MENTHTNGQGGVTPAQILQRIDKIMDDKAHINSAIEAIKNMDGGRPEPNALPDARPTAMAEVVAARESTNRQTLKLLEKMYDDLRPERNDVDAARFAQIKESIEHMMDYDCDAAADILRELTKRVFG